MTMKCFYLFIYGSCWVKCVPQSHSEEGGMCYHLSLVSSQLSHASFLSNSSQLSYTFGGHKTL